MSVSAARQRLSRSTAMICAAPSFSRARVRPPGPGPISTIVTIANGPAARAILAIKLRSKRKFSAERFFCRKTVSWLTTSRNGGSGSLTASLDALPEARRRLRLRKPRRELQRRDEARRIGYAVFGDIEGGAVIGRGAHEG